MKARGISSSEYDSQGVPLARCRARIMRLSHKQLDRRVPFQLIPPRMVDTQSSVRRRQSISERLVAATSGWPCCLTGLLAHWNFLFIVFIVFIDVLSWLHLAWEAAEVLQARGWMDGSVSRLHRASYPEAKVWVHQPLPRVLAARDGVETSSWETRETTNLYKQGVFAAGDAFKARSLDFLCKEPDLLWNSGPGGPEDGTKARPSVLYAKEFGGFMHAIEQVGELLLDRNLSARHSQVWEEPEGGCRNVCLYCGTHGKGNSMSSKC